MTRYDELCDQLVNQPKRWLVTGVAGFIGSALLERLLDLGQTVVGLDNFATGHQHNLDDVLAINPDQKLQFRFIEGDILDPEACRQACEGVDYVLHQAALGSVPRSIKDPVTSHRTNVDGFLNILEGCREHPVEHLCFASTSSIYGDTRDIPYRESQKVQRPVSLYAATKGANELMAHAYAHLFGIPATALRFFTVYGPWGRPDMAPLLFTRAALDGRSIRVFNHGQMRRDFTHVTDIVAGILGALAHPPERSDEGAPLRVLNLGRGEPVDLLRFIELIEQAVGRPIAREYTDMQAGDMVETYADTSAAKALFGYAPAISLEQGVPPLVNWCRDYFASSSAGNAG